VPIKYLVLMLLVVQNSATTLLVKYTRTPVPGGGPLYLGSIAVLISELIKFPTCLALIARDEGGLGEMVRKVRRGVFGRWRDTVRMGVPTLCYGLQNVLFFVALSNLSATSYQLWSQLKTLFTALFFVKLLGQRLSPLQWIALSLLTAGVGLVQIHEVGAGAAVAAAAGAVLLGVVAVLASSLLAGFANIYFEKVLKHGRRSASSTTRATWTARGGRLPRSGCATYSSARFPHSSNSCPPAGRCVVGGWVEWGCGTDRGGWCGQAQAPRSCLGL